MASPGLCPPPCYNAAFNTCARTSAQNCSLTGSGTINIKSRTTYLGAGERARRHSEVPRLRPGLGAQPPGLVFLPLPPPTLHRASTPHTSLLCSLWSGAGIPETGGGSGGTQVSSVPLPSRATRATKATGSPRLGGSLSAPSDAGGRSFSTRPFEEAQLHTLSN